MKTGSATCCLAALAVLSIVAPTWGYTSERVGVGSNIVVADGKVYFIQADRSLTALDLATGRVLLRKKGLGHMWEVQATDRGLLVCGYSEICLIDMTSHVILWQTSCRCDPNVLDDCLVSYDGNGLVQCRRLRDGTVLWSFDLPGALDVIAAKDKVLVHREARFEGTPATVLLDMKTGKELFRWRTPPAGVPSERLYFDGDRVYVASGRRAGGRARADFTQILVWDTSGQQLDPIDVPPDVAKRSGNSQSDAFTIGDKTFDRGRVRLKDDIVPPQPLRESGGRLRWPLSDKAMLAIGGHPATENNRAVADVSVATVALETPEGGWRGLLTHLVARRGRVYAIAHTDDKLLLGSDLGHVECIDLASGKSLWIYVFPTVMETISWSSPGGMGPYMADRAKMFRRSNANRNPTGLCLLPAGKTFDQVDLSKWTEWPSAANRPKVIYDPEPTDPFEYLPFYLAMAWTGVFVPVVLFWLVRRFRKKRYWENRSGAVSALALAAVVIVVTGFFGRVSFSSSLAYKIEIISLFVLAICHTYKAGKDGWMGFAGLMIAAMFFVGYFAIHMIRYA